MTSEYNQRYYQEKLKPRRTKMKVLEEDNAEMKREILFLKSRITILERKLKNEKHSVSILAHRVFRDKSNTPSVQR